MHEPDIPTVLKHKLVSSPNRQTLNIKLTSRYLPLTVLEIVILIFSLNSRDICLHLSLDRVVPWMVIVAKVSSEMSNMADTLITILREEEEDAKMEKG